MVAMLVPERYRHCLTYVSHKLDLGATCAKVLMCMSENEFAVELGGQTFSLSKEIAIAIDSICTVGEHYLLTAKA